MARQNKSKNDNKSKKNDKTNKKTISKSVTRESSKKVAKKNEVKTKKVEKKASVKTNQKQASSKKSISSESATKNSNKQKKEVTNKNQKLKEKQISKKLKSESFNKTQTKKISNNKNFDAETLKREKRERLKEIAERESATQSKLTPEMIASPTDEMLKPFRDAAKINKAVVKKNKSSKKTSFIAKPPKNAKKYSLDLRVHTPLSEGYFSTGGIDPASAMVRLAVSKGLDMIAITDYNTADFIDYVKREAKDTSVTVLPGVDLNCYVGSDTDVSFVALFPEDYSSKEINKVIQLLGIPENAKGRKSFTLREELKKIIEVIEDNGGILIPTRIDTTPYKVKAAKELIENYGFHAFDLVHPDNPEYFKENFPSGEFTFLSSSNANALGQIGSRGMKLKLSNPGFNGIKSLVSRRNSQKSATK